MHGKTHGFRQQREASVGGASRFRMSHKTASEPIITFIASSGNLLEGTAVSKARVRLGGSPFLFLSAAFPVVKSVSSLVNGWCLLAC